MQRTSIGLHTWIDLTQPTPTEIQELISEWKLPTGLLASGVDPEHLPHAESHPDLQFIVLRSYDPSGAVEGNTIQEITRKLVLVLKPEVTLTLHRMPLPYLQEAAKTLTTPEKLVADIVHRSLKTYEAALLEIHQEFESLEERVIEEGSPAKTPEVQRLYALKRRVTLLKRILRYMNDPLEALEDRYPIQAASTLREKLAFQLEEVYDNLIAILSLQISISSQRTNEVMRVLTVYSLIFMPLHLVAGIYGMNFEHMPELKWAEGYPMSLLLMAVIAAAVLYWTKRRGWL